jgi:hypothetical protein
MLTLTDECSHCNNYEERTFRDSWTGMDLCVPCLAAVIEEISLSPGMDGDNLKKLLKETDIDPRNDNDDNTITSK